MATDKACLQKENKNSHLTLPNRNHLLKVTEQGAYEQEKPGTSHSFPLLFLALLLCITKQGSCERVGVEWLDFGAKALLVVFILLCSLFALSLSPPDNTLWANTLGNVLVDFAIFVSPYTKHLGILIDHYLVSFIVPHSYMKDRDSQDQGKGWERKERRVSVVKPKMAACSSKGGETESLNIGELFSCYTHSQVSQESETGSVTVRERKGNERQNIRVQ